MINYRCRTTQNWVEVILIVKLLNLILTVKLAVELLIICIVIQNNVYAFVGIHIFENLCYLNDEIRVL